MKKLFILLAAAALITAGCTPADQGGTGTDTGTDTGTGTDIQPSTPATPPDSSLTNNQPTLTNGTTSGTSPSGTQPQSTPQQGIPPQGTP